MKKYDKAVQQAFLDSEKATLKKLEANYKKALADVNIQIEKLLSRKDASMQNVVYQLQYQKALKTQIEAIISTLHNNEFETVSEYLVKSYQNGYVGTMYSFHNQGIPLVLPIDERLVSKAINHETKLSEDLYATLGKDTKHLSKQIASEISRGISQAYTYNQISENIGLMAKIPQNRAMTIARTEAHRIQCQATADAALDAKKNGCNVVKQWDATLDGRTRPLHRELDGQIRDIEEPFNAGGYEPMQPSDFGDPAEDCNCRCALLERATWALDEDELQTLRDRADYFDLDKSDDFEEFEKKYLKATEASE